MMMEREMEIRGGGLVSWLAGWLAGWLA